MCRWGSWGHVSLGALVNCVIGAASFGGPRDVCHWGFFVRGPCDACDTSLRSRIVWFCPILVYCTLYISTIRYWLKCPFVLGPCIIYEVDWSQFLTLKGKNSYSSDSNMTRKVKWSQTAPVFQFADPTPVCQAFVQTWQKSSDEMFICSIPTLAAEQMFGQVFDGGGRVEWFLEPDRRRNDLLI